MGVCANNKKCSKHQRNPTFESTISTNQTSEKTSSRTFSTIKKEKSNIIFNRISEKTKYEDINKTIKIKDIFLGKGITGIIREGKDNEGNIYAIKSIWKNDIAKNIYFKREIEITLKCIHENIIKCYEIYEDNTSIHLILELCNGGDLFDYIINKKNQKIEEEEAIDILEQILKSLIYLHEEIGIIHRDIKPENFLIKNVNGKNIIKLIDFGFSDFISKDNGIFTEQLGTPQYAAPEIYEGKSYDCKVDLWSVGVVLYNMINGTQPFSGVKNKSDSVKNDVLYKKINFNGFKNPLLRNLAMHLLERDPLKRSNAIQALCELKLIKNSVDNLETIPSNFNPDIKKVMYILNNDIENLKNLRQIYIKYVSDNNLYKLFFDLNRSKDINIKTNEDDKALKEGRIYANMDYLISETLNKKYIEKEFIEKVNNFLKERKEESIKNQLVDVTKFFHVLIESKKFIQKKNIYNEFKKLDVTNKGYLTLEEFNNKFIDINKLNNTPIKQKEKWDFESFYRYYIKYENIRVPSLGIKLKREISLNYN